MTPTLERAAVENFRSFVAQRLGLNFDDSKQDFVEDVLRQRMESTGRHRFWHYQQLISSSAKELQAVAEQLTVCETYFFRYIDHFRVFTEVVVPDRIRVRNGRRDLRILSAGCASGEEAYSLAILIRDELPELASWNIAIQGIDVNPSMVAKAVQAQYTTWSLRDTPANLRRTYFRSQGRDLILDGAVRSMVTFEQRNLVDEDPLFWRRDAFDVVFCRNVTMYFTLEAARSVIARIAQSLTPGGFLFLGHAETLRGISQDFHLQHTHETFYYQLRDAHASSGNMAFVHVSPANGLSPAQIPVMTGPGDSWSDIIRRASERITNLANGTRDQAAGATKETGVRTAEVTGWPVAAWDRTLALELLRSEKFAEAIELVHALPPGLKADPDVQLLLGVLLTNRGDLQEAEKVCLGLLKLDDLNAGAHYLMALCREHAGDRSAAVEHDQAAVYLDSSFAMPHLHLGLMAKRSADVETAKRELEQALTLLVREDASRILLFGGGFTREALAEFCRAELRGYGGHL
ncbi:MAG TPA: CheR family methyltransferase [Candidatus Angelobacter sp.]|jgi:chemotaxis protein methyltransferase CheR|nr:CheR family methyltransferase [Candidatus Angelobacter sp.]